MLQKCQFFTLLLQKSTKKLDGWEIVSRVAQRTGQEVCVWRKKCCFYDIQLPSPFSFDNLKAIKLCSLPPNTTSKTQPMDQGVIRSLKAKYCKNVVQKIIQSVKKKKILPNISLLQGMQMLVSASDALLMQLIMNCSRTSGISTKSQEYSTVEDLSTLVNPILLKRTLMPPPLPMLMLKFYLCNLHLLM